MLSMGLYAEMEDEMNRDLDAGAVADLSGDYDTTAAAERETLTRRKSNKSVKFRSDAAPVCSSFSVLSCDV